MNKQKKAEKEKKEKRVKVKERKLEERDMIQGITKEKILHIWQLIVHIWKLFLALAEAIALDPDESIKALEDMKKLVHCNEEAIDN